MFENTEVLVDRNGDIYLVIPSSGDGGPTWVVLECVSPNDAFAPRE